MVDEVAVDTAVPVIKRMDVDETEREHGRGDHRFQPQGWSTVERNHSVDQGRQVLGPGADVIGQRHARLAIMLAHEAAFVAKPQSHEARVGDDDPLQPEQLVPVQRLTSGLGNRPSPALDTVLGRMLAFDRIARTRILEEEKGRGAREQVARYRFDHVLRARRQIEGEEPIESVRSEYQRAETRTAGQIVPYSVARCSLAFVAILEFGVERVDIAAARIVTDRDIAVRGVASGISPRAPIRRVMSQNVATCSPDDDIGTVLALMSREQIRRMPVCDPDDKLVGIIALADLADHDPDKKEVTETLVDICEPSGLHCQAPAFA